MPPRGTYKDRLQRLERLETTAAGSPPVREASLGSSRGKAKWIKFTLTAALTTSDESAAASVTAFYDGVNPDPGASGIMVYNRLRSGSTYEYAGSIGAIGYAILAAKEDKYYILDFGPVGGADAIHFTLGSDLTTADASVTVTVTRYSGVNPGSSVTAWNDGYFSGLSGDKGQAIKFSDGKYWISQMQQCD